MASRHDDAGPSGPQAAHPLSVDPEVPSSAQSPTCPHPGCDFLLTYDTRYAPRPQDDLYEVVAVLDMNAWRAHVTNAHPAPLRPPRLRAVN